jgi:glutamate synthase (NADPH) small chain
MAKLVPHKTPVAEQPPEIRRRNFDEVTLSYSPEQAMAEARRCLFCSKPGCRDGCPVMIDIPGFLALIADGKFIEAARLIKQANALPAITGRVCPQEEQCEGRCALAKKYESVGIGRLERFVADWEAAHGGSENAPIPPLSGKRVAVVGSGPAGITVAADLALLGHSIKIFEALHQAGGVLVYGIPEFRLPKAIVAREIQYVCGLGVELETDVVVGATFTVDELLGEYDAVFLGTGAGLPWFLNVPGENLNGVYSANEYLTRANLMKAAQFPVYDTPPIRGQHVVTVGGGNVAMDSARTALRLGAETSTIVYRRSRTEMPARQEEIHHAEQEGVIFELLATPVAFHSTDNSSWVREAECIRMTLGEPDASGRRRPVPQPDSNFRLPADVVVISIGQSPNPLVPKTTPDLTIGKGGIIVTDTVTGRTSKPGVFAGGDVATGGATVIAAMGAGKIAAASIDQFLRTGEW